MLRFALLAVSRHPVRSLLAVAGVAVGVCALTSIMSVEQSWRRAVTGFFAPMDLATVRVTIPAGNNWRELGFSQPVLEQTDLEAIRAACSAAEASALVTSRTLEVEAEGGEALALTVRGLEADFISALPDEVREGRLFSSQEAAQQAPVCVLSAQAKNWLFGDRASLNRYLRVAGHRFRVVGVIAGDRHAGMSTRAILVPSTWSRALLKAHHPDAPTTEIFVRTRDPALAVTQIEGLLRKRIGGDGSRPFTYSLWRVRETALHARTRATLYSSIAGLCALLAAGIGIAALLFVSVTERTREIGIQRALGAGKPHIYGEHVLVSLILCSVGALLGTLVSIPAACAGAFATRWQPVLDPLAGEMLTDQAKEFPKLSEAALSISWEAAGIAIILAMVIGAAAAFAPAAEAAGLVPALAIARRGGPRTRVRELLTCLQVCFGVLVLIVLTSYFSVLESQEKAEARSLLGQDRVSVIADPVAAMRRPVDRRYLEAARDAMAAVVTSPAELDAIRRHTPLLTAVTPCVPLALDAQHGSRTQVGMRVVFTTSDAFAYQPVLPAEDQRRMMRAFRSGEAVVVMNPDAKEQLFGRSEPLGRRISIAGKPFVVGAIRPNPPGLSGLTEVLVPVAFYQDLRRRVRPEADTNLLMEARLDARPIRYDAYAKATVQLREALLPLLPTEYRKTIRVSEHIPDTTRQFIFQYRATAVRGAVGALAVLLVALIGLANMLLVSVHQELRETGVRRALGARRSDITLHFLSHGALLTLVGSAAGLIVGSLICSVMGNWAGLPISVSAFWAVVGATSTVLAGTLISLAPALFAAHIHPVEALRYE